MESKDSLQPRCVLEALEERRLFAHVMVAMPDAGQGVQNEQSEHLTLKTVGPDQRLGIIAILIG